MPWFLPDGYDAYLKTTLSGSPFPPMNTGTGARVCDVSGRGFPPSPIIGLPFLSRWTMSSAFPWSEVTSHLGRGGIQGVSMDHQLVLFVYNIRPPLRTKGRRFFKVNSAKSLHDPFSSIHTPRRGSPRRTTVQMMAPLQGSPGIHRVSYRKKLLYA